MKIGIGGSGSTLEGIVDEAIVAEAAGLAAFSISNIFGHDAIAALTVAALRTSRIELLTAVVPCLPRHPIALAQQVLTAQVAAEGRFTLGIGSSHEVVTVGSYAMAFDNVADRMREYLSILTPLLAQEKVDHKGLYFGAKGRVRAPDARATRCVLAALGPRMLDVAGECSDGTILWLTGPKAIRNAIVPRLRAASSRASAEPRIVCGLPIALTKSESNARRYVDETWGRYKGLPSYKRMLDAEGASSPADVALVGDEAALIRALGTLEESGVSTFLGTLVEVEEGCAKRTLEFLGAQT